MDIDILIEDDAWDAAELAALAETACTATLAALGLDPGSFSISILAGSDARIATLNAEFRGKPQPTNVLSWPAEAVMLAPGQIPPLPSPDADMMPHELGDIALAHGACTAEAADLDRPLAHHLTHLLVHGTLHLLGFDHIRDPDAAVMEELETRILARLGVPDPY